MYLLDPRSIAYLWEEQQWIRAQVWPRVRVENYPYRLTHTLVRRLTPDPSVVGNEANRYIRRPMDQGSSLTKPIKNK